MFILFCFFTVNTNAARIEINVPENINGDISSLKINTTTNIIDFLMEFYNTGSVPYKSRIRIDIFENNTLLFTGWSKENVLMPGSRKNNEIAWYKNKTGNYTAKIRLYFGNEIFDFKTFNFQINNSIIPEDTFEIEEFRIYDNFIIFDIKSKKNASELFLIPLKYPKTWIFEQKKIISLKENEKKTIILPYSADVFFQADFTLGIVSNNGEYYSEKTFELKKETNILYHILDQLRIWFSGN